MKEMIEKIPALAPLNKIIDEINDLLDQKEGQEEGRSVLGLSLGNRSVWSRGRFVSTLG